jgi:hypothetical protein
VGSMLGVEPVVLKAIKLSAKIISNILIKIHYGSK